MKVVVFGGTGRTGSQVVQQALQRGWEVTALVRNPSALSVKHAQLRAVQGDVMDAAAVASAIAGQDAVLSALGQRRGSPKDLLTTAGRHIVAGMEKSKVRRLVTLLGAAVRMPGDPPLGFPLGLMFSMVGLMMPALGSDTNGHAKVVTESALDWTIFRPALIVDSPTGRPVQASTSLKLGASSRIGTADLAKLMVDEVTKGEFVRKAPLVTA